MSGDATFYLGPNLVDLYLGNIGSALNINEWEYAPRRKQTPGMSTREEMAVALGMFTKEHLIEMILLFVDNGGE